MELTQLAEGRRVRSLGSHVKIGKSGRSCQEHKAERVLPSANYCEKQKAKDASHYVHEGHNEKIKIKKLIV